MNTDQPDHEWYAKLGTGQAHSVSDKVGRKKKHPLGFVPPVKRPVKK